MFEIGVAYRSTNHRLWLAVGERELIRIRPGPHGTTATEECRPYKADCYDVVRGISVEELCKRWGVAIEDLDRETARRFTPSPAGIKPRPRGSRKQRAEVEEAWRELRTFRESRRAV